MFEYHGWITINTDNKNLKTSSSSIESKIKKVSQLVNNHKNKASKLEIFYQKGQPFIRFDGGLEHYQAWVLKLFFEIGKVAGECDGSMFIKDEENPCLTDQFQMWQMTNGQVKLVGNLTSTTRYTVPKAKLRAV